MGGKISEMVKRIKEKGFFEWLFSERIPAAFFLVMSLVVALVFLGATFILFFIDWINKTTK
jgi:hypothetical protein